MKSMFDVSMTGFSSGLTLFLFLLVGIAVFMVGAATTAIKYFRGEKEEAKKIAFDYAKKVAIIIVVGILLTSLLFYLETESDKHESVNRATNLYPAIYAIKNGLKKVESSGYGMTSYKVRLSLGNITTVTTGELITDLPILPTDVKFYCNDPGICGTGQTSIIDISGDRLSVHGTGSIYVNVAVCGNLENSPPYCISLARGAQDAEAACATACNLKD